MHLHYTSRLTSVLTLSLTLRQRNKRCQVFHTIKSVSNRAQIWFGHWYASSSVAESHGKHTILSHSVSPWPPVAQPTLQLNLGIKVITLKWHQSRWEEVMTFPPIEASAWKIKAAQKKLQANCFSGTGRLRHHVSTLLYTSTLFWTVEQHLDRITAVWGTLE